MNLPPLILASASPRRAQLLRELGLDFRVVPCKTPEVEPSFLTPQETAQLNAHRKARIVAAQQPEALVLGADTVVCLDSMIFGKPATLDDARQTLARLQGRTHRVITGVCLIHGRQNRHRMFAATTNVRFRQLSEAQINQYLAAIDPFDKAGAYAVQEQGKMIIESIDGSYSNVVGLPTEQLLEELANWEQSPIT